MGLDVPPIFHHLDWNRSFSTLRNRGSYIADSFWKRTNREQSWFTRSRQACQQITSMPSSILRNRQVRESIIVLEDENCCKSNHTPPQRLDIDILHLLELEEEYPSRQRPLGDKSNMPSCLATSTKERKRASSPLKQRSVKFQSLHIRTYNQVLGDHPCCTSGLPISLGWTYNDETQVPINDYEICRNPRRNRRQLRLNDLDRREIIMGTHCNAKNPLGSTEESKYCKTDLRRAERKAFRQREGMVGSKRSSRIAIEFFNCPKTIVPGAEWKQDR